jgi:hypothetical protein
MERRSFLTATAGVLLAGCDARAASTARYERISASGDPLRSAFNHDVGKVRIVMLVSPT